MGRVVQEETKAAAKLKMLLAEHSTLDARTGFPVVKWELPRVLHRAAVSVNQGGACVRAHTHSF